MAIRAAVKRTLGLEYDENDNIIQENGEEKKNPLFDEKKVGSPWPIFARSKGLNNI
ncbi:MAG: hypothetical protein GY820_21555 [Gammaproteobacteria bacterium]|nr:hypothetical protein [Gammaproteobacteria bacterium]